MENKMCKKLMIVLAAVLIGLQTVSAQSPPGCTGPGVQLKLDVFYADGITPATGDTLSLCETVIYRTQLCTAGGTSCDLKDGNLILTLPDGTTVNVNPPGGVGLLNAAHPCTPTVTTSYRVNILPGVQARATLNYVGFAITGSQSDPNTTSPVDVSITTLNFVLSCDDQNACTVDTCDPLLKGPVPGGTFTSTIFRMGLCVHTAIVCNDNNVCTTDTCNTVTGCVYTPNRCDDGNPCTDDSCDRSAPAGTDPCHHVVRVCTSTDPCFDASCDPTTGNCVLTPNGGKVAFACPPDIQIPCGAPTDPDHTGGTCHAVCPIDNPNCVLPVFVITWEDHTTPWQNLPPANACTHKDGIIRIFFATDTCGRRQQCNFGQLITFKDTTPPVIQCKGDIVTCNPNIRIPCGSQSGAWVTTSDDCGLPVTLSYTRSDGQSISCVSDNASPPHFWLGTAAFPPGVTTITATATDNCLNKSSCSWQVIVDTIVCSFNECCCNLCIGQSRTLTPILNGVNGVGPFTYVWMKDGKIIPGANGPSYTTPVVNSSNGNDVAGHYSVTITDSSASGPLSPGFPNTSPWTNPACTCTTADYQITVDNLVVQVNTACSAYPTFNPSGAVNANTLEVCNGNTITLNGTYTGGVAPFLFEWQLITSSGPVSYGNSQQLVVSKPGVYRLVVNDASCQASLDTLVLQCDQCVTRDIDYWKSYVITPPGTSLPPGDRCVTLQEVFKLLNFNLMNIGFLNITMDQAIGMLWNNVNQSGGTGSDQAFGDSVCTARKLLSQQLIAAIANVTLLNPNSANCGVEDPNTGCFYPIAQLIQEAQAATSMEPGVFDCTPAFKGAWLTYMGNLTTWLQMFNASGKTLPFPAHLQPCGLSQVDANYIASHRPDPTTKTNCACP